MARTQKPTLRQKHAIQAVIRGEAKSITQAMRIAGYSEISARTNHGQLTDSPAWKETIEKNGITLDSISKRHGELLASSKEDIAMKAVDIGYKVNGMYERANYGATFNAPVMIQIHPPAPQKPIDPPQE